MVFLFFIRFFIRNKKIIVFGAFKNSYADNSRYLFEQCDKELSDYDCVWITSSKSIRSKLKAQNMKSAYRWSIRGVFLCLRAKYYVYNSYVSDINFWFSRRAVFVNLWHGIPLKKIEFDISEGPLKKVYQPKNELISKIINPIPYQRPSYMFAPSNYVAKLFQSAFRVEKKISYVLDILEQTI
ncbi:hypothetical protein BGC07_08625 [Piscirickettsia litoralis]|uniref:Uncharacterized protein n=1 Tax=Piscirickettsia litoralis TaxID=1891921 RepID=A0ABX3A2B4_9GAMM|nr:CDP-glycerol glycerophosphotransferase family protein [Piscirickettsia litoralis]ODN42973.1 hypothetical protein BGC07_08625 [Piscirickettsia litoralis]